MFDIIAVPVDGSEYGYNAVDVAIEIAKKFDSKIAAIHVLRNSLLVTMVNQKIMEIKFWQKLLKRLMMKE